MDRPCFFEDFTVGETIELGTSPVVTEAEIVEFARRFDPQPIHLDHGAADASIYGGLIASGWHTGALAMRLLVDKVLAGSASQGSPGVDEIRFVRPVRPGDQLSGRVTVEAAEPSVRRPGVGKIALRLELCNQRGETVLTWKSLGLFSRREFASAAPGH